MLPCHVSITPVPSWKQDRREQEFVRRASGKASIVAALLLPSTTQWGQRERERERHRGQADTWRQTRRRGITKFAGAALLPWTQAAKHAAVLTVGTQVSKTASKAGLRKISLWLVRWEGGAEDVCCISFGKYRLHVWSGFIRLLVKAMTQNASCQLVWVHSTSPKDGGDSQKENCSSALTATRTKAWG